MRYIVCFCFIFLFGCAHTMQSHLDNVQKNFSNANFELQESDTKPAQKNNLDLLLDASALFHENKFKESDDTFEEFNKRNMDETSSSISRETANLFLGGGVNSYKPYMMDSLFVSYYQIWDLLALHDWSNARAVINQSYIRQQKMSHEYEKLITENKSSITKNSVIQDILDKNKNDWAAFTDIMNPALMYLSGIYFLNDGDFANAETYLKRANGMMSENEFIKSDLKMAQQKIKPKDTTWVFIESGFAPRLREKNFSLFLPSIGMIYFSFSEPYFNNATSVPDNAQLLADVDKMFMTEYNEYSVNEILRSYTSAVSKATLQATTYNSHSNAAPWLGILSSVYTVASSNTDVRTWATLPKDIYVIRIENDKTDLNENYLNDTIKSEMKSDNKNNLVYIRKHEKITDAKIIKLK